MENVRKLLGNGMDVTEDTGMGKRRETRGLTKEGQAKEGSGYDDTEEGGLRDHNCSQDHGSHEGDELGREEYGD